MITMLHGLIGSPSNWTDVKEEIILKDDIFWNPYLNYMMPTASILKDLESRIELSNDNLNISIGNSLGCYLSLILADKFDQIILVSPPYKFSSGSIFLSKERMKQLLSQLFYNPSVLNDFESLKIEQQLKMNLKDIKYIRRLKTLKKELTNFNFKEAYFKNQHKIHFVLGENDQITPFQEFSDFVAKECPEASIDIIKDCGHAIPVEKPIELARIITRFTKGNLNAL